MALRTLGDVLARSGPCVTVSEDATILTLAKALVKHRVDAVSVLSASDNKLCGIATARDVAKCLARNLDLDTANVSLVMTPNPITLPPLETPANALSLMRQGRFRHIPVVAHDSSVLGVVDVLSLAYDAITRLQLSYSLMPSRRGYDMLRAARETIEKPTLRPIIERTLVTTLKRDATVAAACELIVTKHIAAIVVVDENNVLDGIFTCTDIVKRVVIPDGNPNDITLGEVMTSNPDCAGPDFTILESLQRMQACGFRHLPVVDDHSRVVVGLVDVLQLASDTLLDLNSAASKHRAGNLSNSAARSVSFSSRISGQMGDRPSRDMPAGGRSGLGRGIAALFGGLFSNSFGQRDGRASNKGMLDAPGATPPIDALLQNAQTQKSDMANSSMHLAVDGLPTRRHYSYLASNISGKSRHARADVPLASFKFKDTNGDFCRIKVPMELEKGDFDHFVLDVRRRYAGSAGSSMVGVVKIKYVDEDGDDVLIANDDDLASCFEDVVDIKKKTIVLKVEEVDRVTGSKIQSPVSSAPSSVLGSPGQRSTASSRQDVGGALKPSVEPPPLEQEVRTSDRPTGVYRTNSKRMIHTPSSLKAAKGHELMLDQRIDEAIVVLSEAVELDPDNARAFGERGAARLLNGNSVDAEEDYRAARAIFERKGFRKDEYTFQMCLVGLVECLIDQRRYEEAMAVGKEMPSKFGNSGCTDAFRDEVENASNAARDALESGAFGDAMSCYSNALRVEMAYLQLMPEEKGRASLRLGRAKCYKALEDYDMALEDYEAAVELEAESVAAHKGCGKCFMELEQWDRALEAYQKAHMLDAGDGEVVKVMETIKAVRPDPLKTKKDEIAKLGALLGGMNLPGAGK